jgi:surfeit locus 1 family protein
LSTPQPSPPQEARRSWRGLLLPAGLAFVVLIGLGTWQIQRKAWKEALIASLTAQLAAPPVALIPPADWPSLDPARDEYHRVTFSAQFDYADEALVFAAASAFRPDVSGPGYWVFTPARLAGGGLVVVNRGFVPDGRQDPKSRAGGNVRGVINVVGAMRWPDTRHWFTPNDDPAHNLWFSRDPRSIAAAKGFGQGPEPLAPFFVEQESPSPPGGLPQPGKIVVDLPNNHLQYAVTWYGLALVLVVVFVTWAFGSGRRRKSGTDAASPSL